ncbi:MAG: DpnI domain-containing protein [Ferruginibacter sp.]
MNCNFDISIKGNYQSQSQIARVLTEHWVKENSYCPNCGNDILTQFDNNKPVADFFCKSCMQEYELKSKTGTLGNKIVDGAYTTMIKRIASDNNPNFFFLTYDSSRWLVRDFLVIPKHYFVPDLVEKRKPLSDTARRAGWTGCNILLNKIPSSGRIFLVKNAVIVNKDLVVKKWQKTDFLKDVNQQSKGWLLDILNCIDSISNSTFQLDDIYRFVTALQLKYPNNNFIKDKIRQQLQILRDKGILEFISRGQYKKTNSIL